MNLLHAAGSFGWRRTGMAAIGLLCVAACIYFGTVEPPAKQDVPRNWAVNVGWTATLVCVLWTIAVATAYGRTRPVLFGALAAFALAWAVLIPYYGATSGSGDEMLSALQGLLLILSGGPLRRYASRRERVGAFDRWGLRLLLTLVLPHVVFFPRPGLSPEEFHRVVVAILGCVLIAIGFLSIADGARRITDDGAWKWLLVVIAPYAAAESAFAFRVYGHPGQPMPTCYLILFALLKVALTAVFTWLVARATPVYRRVGWSFLRY